jgi:hypothetical protein
MGEPHILTTLRCRREKIEAAIAAYEAKIEAARFDLAAIDRTLALFQPGYGRRQIPAYFELGRLWKRGELAALCLATLEKDGPLDAAQLASRIAEALGLDATDALLRKMLAYRVARALSYLLRRNKVGSAGDRKGARIWSVQRETNWNLGSEKALGFGKHESV